MDETLAANWLSIRNLRRKSIFFPLPRSLSIFLVPSLPFFTFLYSPLYLQNKPKYYFWLEDWLKVSLTNSWHLPQKLCSTFFTQILVSTPRLFDISAFFATGSGGAAGQRGARGEDPEAEGGIGVCGGRSSTSTDPSEVGTTRDWRTTLLLPHLV